MLKHFSETVQRSASGCDAVHAKYAAVMAPLRTGRHGFQVHQEVALDTFDRNSLVTDPASVILSESPRIGNGFYAGVIDGLVCVSKAQKFSREMHQENHLASFGPLLTRGPAQAQFQTVRNPQGFEVINFMALSNLPRHADLNRDCEHE